VRALGWIKAHKWASALAGLVAACAAAYGAHYFFSAHGRLVALRTRALHKKHARPPAAGDAEREIISASRVYKVNAMALRPDNIHLLVILGADAVPYGPAVVRDFQRNGYVVVASVSSGEAADELERDTRGYVRALVLDAEEVSMPVPRLGSRDF
jgi:hypothetical protein